MDAENSASSALQGATNDAHPTPLLEGWLLQMITEKKAQMEEPQIQMNLEQEQATLDRENARRGREQAALDRENAFWAREALEQSNEQLRAQIVTLWDSQKRQSVR